MEEKQSDRVNKFFYASLIFAFCFILSNIKIEDPDAFIHLKLGEYIVTNLSIPSVDPFVYTYSEDHYNNSSWLSQLIYYFLYKIASFQGLIIFNAILVGFTYSVLFLLTEALGINSIISVMMILTISYASKERFVLRPHIFSLLFLSMIVYMSFINSHKKRTLSYFLLFLLWANLHSGFIYWLIILGSCAVESILKVILKKYDPYFLRSFKNFAAAVAGSMVTPIPFAGYRFSTGLFRLKSTADVLEWRGLIATHYSFLLSVVIVCVLLALFNWRKNNIKDWLILSVFVPAGFWASRNAYELLIVIPPYAITGLDEIFKQFKTRSKFISGALKEISPLLLVLLFLLDFRLNDFYYLIGHGEIQEGILLPQLNIWIN